MVSEKTLVLGDHKHNAVWGCRYALYCMTLLTAVIAEIKVATLWR